LGVSGFRLPFEAFPGLFGPPDGPFCVHAAFTDESLHFAPHRSNLSSVARRLEMKRSFVRALSLVSLLAVPAGLIAQAATAPAPTTTTTTTTTEKKAATGTKKMKAKKHHKKMHHHMKSTAPKMSPTPASK
jgi:hypothetical protein